MKTFRVLRNNDVVTIVEFSFKDVINLLLGREHTTLTGTNTIVMRQPKAYQALNLTAVGTDS